MQQFALWLCDPATTDAHISLQGLQPPVLASAIEAKWLWDFLKRVEAGQSLLSRAQAVAAMPAEEKAALGAWIQTVSAFTGQFQPVPTPWPINQPATSDSNWKAFKKLMEAFYEKGLRSGLPYLPDGTPTTADGVNYDNYVEAFRTAHRLNPNPDAREVCVLCGGPLGDTPHVDHWIIKSEFPLLSVCADNLSLICSTCNEAPNKGVKPVYSDGSFAHWFHPYLRPGNGSVRLDYVLADLSVQCSAMAPADQPKAVNLDALLNLSRRWTREFKAEYQRQKNVLIGKERRRLQKEESRHTQFEVLSYVQQWQAELVTSEPHYDVHKLLAEALQEPSRLAAWHTELGLVQSDETAIC